MTFYFRQIMISDNSKIIIYKWNLISFLNKTIHILINICTNIFADASIEKIFTNNKKNRVVNNIYFFIYLFLFF